jgi:multiple sugar transport system permease protein
MGRWSKKKLAMVGICILFVVWSFLPVYYVVRMSFMYNREISAVPGHLIPEMPTVTNYQRVFGFTVNTPYGIGRPSVYSEAIVRGLLNSVYVAIPVTLITLLISIPTAYSFGRYRFRLKKGLLFGILFSRSVPPVSIIIPFFMLFMIIGLKGTIPGLIIAHLGVTLPISIWIMIGFFANLPREVESAARIDGCSRVGALTSVVVPMASSGIAAVGIFAFLTSWNEFLMAWILNTGTPYATLPVVVPEMVQFLLYINELAVVTVISLLPPILIVLVLERYIVSLRIVDPVSTRG